MRRSLIALVAAVLALAVAPAPATEASVQWCWDDPVVVIDGRPVSINIGVFGTPRDVRANVSAAELTIYVPEQVLTRLSLGVSFYFREHVTFQRLPGRWQVGEPLPVRVEVTFKANKEMRVAVEVINPLSHTPYTPHRSHGSTKSKITTSFTIAR
jgi:hypothetical protein